ncbi:MAG: hypothetical protein PHQ12_11295 [Chthoniobacteraceae bacterium]|nr:hypothetical protein [Chthoniobacteraceae bacterium]
MRSLRFLLPLLALALMAGTSKPKVTIRFHTEAHSSSGSQFTVSATDPDSSRPITLSKFAEISENDVVAIFPFPASDGTIGCSFRLDNHGRIALDSLSQEYHGTLLFAFVNARPVAAMLIDRRVADGVVTIPRGLRPEEIEAMRKAFPVLGEKKGKGAKKASAATSAEIVVPPPLQLSGD